MTPQTHPIPELDALPLPELLERAASMIEEDYESTTECHTIDGVWTDDEWSKGVKTLVDEQAKVVKSLRSRADALRKAQEGREPVAWLTREQIDSIMTQHYPLDSLLRENVDAFEACVRDIEKALFSSPPPKSDEERDAERLLIAAQAVVDWHGELGHDSLAMAELRAALAAQQKGGEA